MKLCQNPSRAYWTRVLLFCLVFLIFSALYFISKVAGVIPFTSAEVQGTISGTFFDTLSLAEREAVKRQDFFVAFLFIILTITITITITIYIRNELIPKIK